MTRILLAAATGAWLCVGLCASAGNAQGDAAWGTLKGRIIWGGKVVPPPRPLLQGGIPDEKLVINPKNRGIKWVFVWLSPDPGAANAALPIHPSLKQVKAKTITLRTHQGRFVPRSLAIRQGQDLVVLNDAPVNHNIQWISVGANAPGGNVTLPPGKSHTIKGLVAEKLPLTIRDNIYPWMGGRVAVFDHPYYAVTDEDGKFEIKLAPTGKFRLMVYQEVIGWRGGAKGRNGEEVTIKAGGVTDLGELKMGGQ